jgi:dehydrogenase/reductase SDR family protein 12
MLIEKHVTIERPISFIYQYVLDFSQLYEWDDHVTEGHRIDLGPIKVGSRFWFIYSLGGSRQKIQYTITSLEENRSIVLNCLAPSFEAVDTISFSFLSPQQTKVTYRAEINVHNKFKDFIFSGVMNRIGNRVVTRLKEVLENKEITETSEKNLSVFNIPYRFSSSGWNCRRKNFSATESKSKTVLITGPTSGLGKSVTYSLAGKGCDLILVGRSHEKLALLEADLRKDGFQKSIQLYVCDMQDLESVEMMCEKVTVTNQIDVLINNAGALFSEAQSIKDVERTTVVDLLAPWILSCRLIPHIRPDGCVVNVSSGGMYGARLNIPELKKAKEPFSGSRAYAVAKRAMEMFSNGLNTELKSRGIRIHCMHPGWADTPGVLNSLPGFHRMTKTWLRSSFQGADTIVWLAMNNPEPGGNFWLDRQIQPRHILASTEGHADDYVNLRAFLDAFATPHFSRESE